MGVTCPPLYLWLRACIVHHLVSFWQAITRSAESHTNFQSKWCQLMQFSSVSSQSKWNGMGVHDGSVWSNGGPHGASSWGGFPMATWFYLRRGSNHQWDLRLLSPRNPCTTFAWYYPGCGWQVSWWRPDSHNIFVLVGSDSQDMMQLISQENVASEVKV